MDLVEYKSVGSLRIIGKNNFRKNKFIRIEEIILLFFQKKKSNKRIRNS